jgi:hypothetical protein
MGTHESDRHGSDLGGDVVNIGDRLSIDEAILRVKCCTCTFFSERRTTESLPLMAMAVNPQVFTALKAYST